MSFCNASLPFLKSDLPGLPQGLRNTFLFRCGHLPLSRDHQYESSLQQGHLSYHCINKMSYAIAFVLLQAFHKSLKECISPLCTGNISLYKDSCLWDFTLGLKARSGKIHFPVTLPEENSILIAHQNHRVCRKSSSQWVFLGRQNISCTE